MKGATVDTMALAVEGSAVVLIGVSRAYKESSNCRMEAQYALQKKKPLVPLMLMQGYEADGWLGLLLGTSMWYALYGAEMLIASGVMDALEYGILHDFACAGLSVASYASGAAVALVGRNEGGKVLRCEAVHAVLGMLHVFFQPESWLFAATAKSVMAHVARISIMVISDANKKHMLQYEPLIDMLLQCLIIDDDNHRKGQDGADALQEASAGVLHELSLYGPGAAALRSHGSAVSTLHKLCEVGTKTSKERGAAALFELTLMT